MSLKNFLNRFSIFILLLFVFIFFLYNIVYTSNIKYSLLQLITNRNYCNPINETYVPFKIKINGIEYPKHVSPHLNKSISFECLNKVEKHKVILFWNEFWAWKEFGIGKDEIFLKHKCPVTRCEITNDKSRLNQSDFVVVGDGGAMQNPPSYRPKNQRWIFLVYESPYLANNDYSKYNGVFNLTATHLSNADFLTTYEGSAQMTWEMNKDYKIPYSNKTKLAAALISNCWSDNSRRMDFINQLRKYIVVDVYGSCGNKKCPDSPIKSVCKELIASEYKFYFAFENSLCDDYITEKFFAMLKYNIVPVVLGDIKKKYMEFVSNLNDFYKRFLKSEKFLKKVPSSGFIDVIDFKSPKDLANYLQYLDSNKEVYYKYFEWKKYVTFTDYYRNYTAHSQGVTIFCDFCLTLHLEDYYGIKSKIIYDMSPRWWSIKSNCHPPNFF